MTSPRERSSARSGGRRGFSLVEVLLASGLLAAVLLSISGLFILGSQGVKSGRELTRATTIANSAVEKVLGWPYDLVWGLSGAAATETTKEWNTTMANPGFTGSTADVALWNATLDEWRNRVKSDLHLGELLYRVDGVARLPSDTNDGLSSFRTAHYIRVSVTVSWTESRGRRRHVTIQQLVL